VSDRTTPGAGSDVEPETDDLFPEQEDDLRAPRQPVTIRGVAIVGARVVTGVLGVGVAVVAIAAAGILPLPSVTAVAPSVTVVPVPTAQQLVCSGSVLRLSDDSGQGATQASALGIPRLDAVSSTGSVDRSPLEQTDADSGGTASAPLVVSTPPDPADPAEQILLSGAQEQELDDGDFVGLAASACQAPGSEAWLVGGATTVGRTTLITLSNPSEVPATVDLEIIGESGPVAAPGTRGIVVPPNGQRVLSLAGFAPELESPVVHVTSTGGQIVAELQQSIVRGLVPGGVDIVGPSVVPATDILIPGLVVRGADDVTNTLGIGPGFEDLTTVLRVYVPGSEPADATIRVIPEDGVGTGTSFAFTFDPGVVSDVPIPELADGSYTIRVESPVALTAAARVSAASGDLTDLAWLAAAPPLTAAAQVTIADGPEPRLHLVNPTDAAVTVELAGVGADDLSAEIAPGSAVSLTVEPGATYVVSGFGSLHAGVSFIGDGLVARYAVAPPGTTSTPILVYP
jgi:hypothetical protein